MVLPAGTMIDAKYRVVRLLGAGGMGEVYEVENVLVRRGAALKLLPLSASPELVARFEAEAEAAGRAGSKRIVDVFDRGRTPEGQAYLVMELLDGETLRDELRRARRMSPRRAAALVADVLRGLEAAHRAGIIHRDLKPENIWILGGRDAPTAAADAPLVKILDFGVSKFTAIDEGRPRTAEGAMIGTCWYMSPEQIRDARRSDARSDVYALGVILHELLAGTVPFPGTTLPEMLHRILNDEPPSLRDVAPDVPEAIARIVSQALAKRPEERFESAGAMREHLGAFLEGQPPPPDGLPIPALRIPAPIPAPPVPAGRHDGPPVPDIPTPEARPAPPEPPPRAPVPSAPISLAEPPPARGAELAAEPWPRAPLLIGAVAIAVIALSLAVGMLFRADMLGS